MESEINIKMDARNARKHSKDNKSQIKKSVDELGAGRSIVIDNDNEIIAGNGLFEQWGDRPTKIIETTGDELIVVKRTDLNTDDEKRKALAIADNKTGDSSEFDDEVLSELLNEITDEDLLEATAFSESELDELNINPDEEPDEEPIPEPPEEPKTELGRMYQLGKHRLMCGDSTSEKDVNALMGGELATLAHNDPPYGMKKENEGVLNDNLNFDDLLNFNKLWIDLEFKHLKDNGSFYCWGIDEPLMDIYSHILKPLISEQKATFRNLLTWNKGNGQGQMAKEFRSYANADEKCLFVMCGVQGFNNNADNYFEGWESIRNYLYNEKEKSLLKLEEIRLITNSYFSRHSFTKSQWDMPTEESYKKIQTYCEQKKINAFKKEYEELKKEYYSTRAYFDNTHDNMNNVWNIKRTSEEERETTGGHATPKPLELCHRVIKSSSQENDIVLDLFGGSGSTLIACENTKRQCRMMELEPKYCDVIVERYCNLKGIDSAEVFKTGTTETLNETCNG